MLTVDSLQNARNATSSLLPAFNDAVNLGSLCSIVSVASSQCRRFHPLVYTVHIIASVKASLQSWFSQRLGRYAHAITFNGILESASQLYDAPRKLGPSSSACPKPAISSQRQKTVRRNILESSRNGANCDIYISPILTTCALLCRRSIIIHPYPCLCLYDTIVYGLSETLEASAFLKGIKEEAASSNIWVSVGLHEVPESGGDQEGSKKRCYNSQCLVTPEGELASVYRKLHLFDVDFKGSLSISESGTTLKGDALPEVTETAVGKGEISTSVQALSSPPSLTHASPSVGMLTCYDLRFPEVALILRKQGADIITYPSAFAVRTGMAHWGQ